MIKEIIFICFFQIISNTNKRFLIFPKFLHWKKKFINNEGATLNWVINKSMFVNCFFSLFSVFKNNFLFLKLKNLFDNSKWTKNENSSQNSVCKTLLKTCKRLFSIFSFQKSTKIESYDGWIKAIINSGRYRLKLSQKSTHTNKWSYSTSTNKLTTFT